MSIPRPSARALAQAAGVAGAAFLLLGLAPSPAEALPLGLDKLNPFGALLDFGVKEGGKLVLSIIGGLVDLLLPDEIGRQGAAIIQWIGSGPDFALAIKTVPSLRTLLGYSLWLGFSILPATLAYAGLRSMLGDGPPVTELAGRLLGALVVLGLWPYIWQLLPLLTSNITAVYLKNTAVVAGLNRYVELLVTGAAVTAALGALTWPLLALVVMGVGGFFFVSLLVFKAGLWIIGAAVYMGGPILVGFILTDRGMQMIRSVSAIVVAVFALPIVWSMILAVTAITVGAGGAMTRVLGGAGIGGHIFGALMIGAVAIMGPAMCFALGKAILGGVAGSVLSTARSVTSRSGGGAAGAVKAGSAPPKSAGAGASTVAAVRGNMTRGWNRGLGGVGPQPAGTGRMAMHTAKSGGLAGAGGTVAGAIWRSQGSSLKKTMAGAQTARAAAGQKIGRTTTAAAVGAQNLAAKAVPGMRPMTAGAGAPTHAMGAVPPQPKPPRERATRRGREDQVSSFNAEAPPTSRNGNGNGASPSSSRNGSGDGPSSSSASTPPAGTDRPSGSAARSARANGGSAAPASNGASSNGGGEGATPAAKASGSRPRRDRGSSSPTPSTPSQPSSLAAQPAVAPSQPRSSRGPRREASSRPAPDLTDRPNTTPARSADDQEEQS